MKHAKHLGLLFLLCSGIVSPQTNAPQKMEQDFKLDYEKFELENGLEVILHVDKSDPIVAVATVMHVGSNREKPGKTGFAHFFEHMSFNDSENVPVGANRKMIPEWGGSRNGGTWSDGTIYYEVVPKDAFEKILWIDSDRFGYMINTVTKAALEREKQVVKNEKRQRVDNAPYGYTDEIIRKNLYPKGHPYSWTVIGSLPDLQAATLADVKEFYHKYYGAANASLVIAGDIDKEAYGNEEKSVPVKKPLMVLATLPRKLSPAEKVMLPVTVFAMDKKVKNVSIQVKTTDGISVVGNNSQSISFSKPDEKMLFFELDVKKANGVNTVEVIASGNGEKTSHKIELDVYNPNPITSRVLDNDIKAKETQTINFETFGVAGSNTASIELSTLPPMNFTKRMGYLIQYPHGCVEQTTSSVFPQLFLTDLFDLTYNKKQKIQNNIEKGIA
ncbi:MAG: insulinase family protein, partial [Marinirhabdus sp.]